MSAGLPRPPEDARDWALFLDLDGTLLELAPTPDAVRVPPELPARLATLARRLDGALALISGRPLADLDRFFPLRHDAAGCHGAQWRRGGGEQAPAEAEDRRLARAAAALRDGLRDRPGLWLEDKPHALALHYRQAPALEPEAQALAERALAMLGPGFRAQGGKRVIELLPAWAGKGNAIRRFMTAPPYAGRVPVFAGDDLTDEAGFAAVNDLGGIAIQVGTGPGAADGTQARFRLDTPADLRDWLARLTLRETASTTPA